MIRFKLFVVFLCLYSTTCCAAFSVGLTSTNATCNSLCNGSILASASGGISPYQYSIDGGLTWQMSGSFLNLCANTYTILAKDSALGTASATIVVTQPLVLSFTLSSTNCTAWNICNGTISVNAIGGNPPYVYHIVGPNVNQFYTTSPMTGFCAGTYTISVTDATSCPCIGPNNPATVTITAPPPPPPLSVTLLGSVPNCPYSSQSITASVSGGQPPYQYSWNGGNWSNTTSMTGLVAPLSPSTYTVCVRDANNSVACATITPGWPVMFQGGSSAVTPSQCGACTGSVSIYVTGGVWPIHYNLVQQNTNISLQGTGTLISNICPGNYTLYVTDNSGCPLPPQYITINETPLPLSTSVVQPCNNSCNGSITLSTTVSATYQYSINGGVTWQNSPTFSGLCAGTYTVTIQNVIRPSCMTSSTVTLTQGSTTTVTSSIVPVGCSNPNSGSITALASPAASYTYSINLGATWQSSNTFSGLPVGSYVVWVKNMATSCITTLSATISNAPPIVATALTTNISCFGSCTGAISVLATPLATYQYSINGGVTWQTSGTFTGLCANTYTILTKNITTNCVATTSTTISQPPALITNIASQTNILCNGSNSGAASLSAFGGTGVLQYDWSPGSPSGDGTPNVTGLSGGTWTCTVVDANGCSATRTVAITQPPAISASLTAVNSVSCFGGNTGSASVSASGGTGTLTYSWAPSGGNSPTASGLFQGTYTCTITDANLCTITQTVGITQPIAPVSASLTAVNPVSCFGGNTGSASVSASGGTGTLTYSWAPSGGNSPTAFGLFQGTYTCTITDANLCTITQTVGITQPIAPVSASLTAVNHVSCFGGNTGSASVSASGGTGSLSYVWMPSGGNAATATALHAGTYTCTVTDANGCFVSQTVNITEPPLFTNSITSTTPICYGTCSGVISVTSLPIATYQYSIDGGNSWSSLGTFTNLCSGTYSIIAQDAIGCQITTQTNLVAPPQVQAVAAIHPTSCNGVCDGMISVNVSPSGNYQYSFNYGNTWQTDNFIDSICDGGFNIITQNTNGCRDTILGVTILQPPAVQFNTQYTSLSCAAQCTGIINIIPVQGRTPYSFSDDNGNSWQSNPLFYNLCAGMYNVAMRDSLGCLLNDSILLTEPTALNTSATLVPTSCNQCNGGASFLTIGGTPPYSYNWVDFGGPYPGSTLCANTYTVILTDSLLCADTLAITIAPSTTVMIDSISTTPAPSSFATGTASIYPIGTPPFSFQWDVAAGYQTTQTATGLLPGFYCVIVTDALGCSDSACTQVPVITTSVPVNFSGTISIFPNPFENELVISGNGTYHLFMTNITGQILADFGEVTLNASNHILSMPSTISSGMYFIHAENEYREYVYKAIRN